MNVAMFWMLLLIALLIIEMATMGLTTIWFAGGALAAMLLALAGAPVFLQTAFFLLASLLLLFSTRPLAVRYFNRERARTNVEGLVGRQAMVLQEIDNLGGKGQVRLDGIEWSARAAVPDGIIPEGSVVEIRGIQGVKLIVDRVNLERVEAGPEGGADLRQ